MPTLLRRLIVVAILAVVLLWTPPLVRRVQGVSAFVDEVWTFADVGSPATTQRHGPHSDGSLDLVSGDTLVVFVAANNETSAITIGESPSRSNTYTEECVSASGLPIGGGGNSFKTHVFMANITTGGTSTFITSGYTDSSGRFQNVVVEQYRGFATSAFDQCHVGGAQSSTTISSGSVTTTFANEYLVGAMFTTPVPTPDATFTQRTSFNDGALFQVTASDKSVSATGSYSYTGTQSSGDWEAAILTIKQPAGGGGVTCRRSMLGVGCEP